MIIKFLDEAQFELDEAIDFYNNESDGLGSVFLQEVLSAVDRIAKNTLMRGIRYLQIHEGARHDDFLMLLSTQN